MVDMNAEMFRCCGYEVEISGYRVELCDGRPGRRVTCELCGSAFDLPGDLDAVKAAIPDHFRQQHAMQGELEPWTP